MSPDTPPAPAKTIPKGIAFAAAGMSAMAAVVLSALFAFWATTQAGGGRMAGLPIFVAAAWAPVTLSLGALVGYGLVTHGASVRRAPHGAMLGMVCVLGGTLLAQLCADAWFTIRLDLPWTPSLLRTIWRSDAALFPAAVTVHALVLGSLYCASRVERDRKAIAVAASLGLGIVTAPATLTYMLGLLGRWSSAAVLPTQWGVPIVAVLVFLYRRWYRR